MRRCVAHLPKCRDRKDRHQQTIGRGASPKTVLDERQFLFSIASVCPPPTYIGGSFIGRAEEGRSGTRPSPGTEYIGAWPANKALEYENIYQEILSKIKEAGLQKSPTCPNYDYEYS
jgi:hypothetical protein